MTWSALVSLREENDFLFNTIRDYQKSSGGIGTGTKATSESISIAPPKAVGFGGAIQRVTGRHHSTKGNRIAQAVLSVQDKNWGSANQGEETLKEDVEEGRERQSYHGRKLKAFAVQRMLQGTDEEQAEADDTGKKDIVETSMEPPAYSTGDKSLLFLIADDTVLEQNRLKQQGTERGEVDPKATMPDFAKDLEKDLPILESDGERTEDLQVDAEPPRPEHEDTLNVLDNDISGSDTDTDKSDSLWQTSRQRKADDRTLEQKLREVEKNIQSEIAIFDQKSNGLLDAVVLEFDRQYYEHRFDESLLIRDLLPLKDDPYEMMDGSITNDLKALLTKRNLLLAKKVRYLELSIIGRIGKENLRMEVENLFDDAHTLSACVLRIQRLNELNGAAWDQALEFVMDQQRKYLRVAKAERPPNYSELGMDPLALAVDTTAMAIIKRDKAIKQGCPRYTAVNGMKQFLGAFSSLIISYPEICRQVRNLEWTRATIIAIYVRKMKLDDISDPQSLPRLSFNEVVLEYFFNRVHIRSLAEQKVVDLVMNVRFHMQSDKMVRMFARLTGITDAYISQSHLDFYLYVVSCLQIREVEHDEAILTQAPGREVTKVQAAAAASDVCVSRPFEQAKELAAPVAELFVASSDDTVPVDELLYELTNKYDDLVRESTEILIDAITEMERIKLKGKAQLKRRHSGSYIVVPQPTSPPGSGSEQKKEVNRKEKDPSHNLKDKPKNIRKHLQKSSPPSPKGGRKRSGSWEDSPIRDRDSLSAEDILPDFLFENGENDDEKEEKGKSKVVTWNEQKDEKESESARENGTEKETSKGDNNEPPKEGENEPKKNTTKQKRGGNTNNRKIIRRKRSHSLDLTVFMPKFSQEKCSCPLRKIKNNEKKKVIVQNMTKTTDNNKKNS